MSNNNIQQVSILIPGSKSISNRALILATLSRGTTIIKNVAICDDTNYMIENLKKLGVKIQENGTILKVEGIYKKGKLNFPHSSKPIHLYTGNAGTTTRFLKSLATLTSNEIIIDGDARMRERPIGELIKALNQLGAKISSKNGCLPIIIKPSPLKGGTINLPGNISSQYLSAILMIAPFAMGKTTINIEQKLCSRPYIEMTLKMMEKFGLKVKNKKFEQFTADPLNANQKKQPKTYTVESDASSASYFGAYAALHPNRPILLQNIHKKSLQGDIQFLDYLKKMGCKIIEQKNGTLIKGPANHTNLKCPGTIDMNTTPDLVMTFAVLAIFTEGKTRINNIANLRIKETDRLSALENEIKKLIRNLNLEKNISVKTGSDWIEIHGFVKINRSESPVNGESKNRRRVSQYAQQSIPIQISTYNDHRMAMSFGILTDLIPNMKIENPGCVSKSYPTFWEDLKKVSCEKFITDKKNTISQIPNKKYPSLAKTLHKNIVLTGLRGSGKSTLGKLVTKKLNKLTNINWQFVDIDSEIEKNEEMTIKDIVANKGWKYFRTVEKKITKEIAKLKNTVISTGGGTILDPENLKALKKYGKIIYLHVKPEIAAKRIINDKNRPPLTNKKSTLEELKQLYKERHAHYSKSANLILKRSTDLKKDAAKLLKLL